jgi:uncharacterized membrane protein
MHRQQPDHSLRGLVAVANVLTWFVLAPGLFMFAWNWVVPDIFGLHPLALWQAFMLRMLIYLALPTTGIITMHDGQPGEANR